tara:strand:- start:374 stop:1300 length:927 start_codon:yes stop_codon:yes gene_type:complete
MGVVISFLRELVEKIAKENKSSLYIGGFIITFTVVSLSGLAGWFIERLYLLIEIKNPFLGTLLFSFTLSSSIASRSLYKSILEIINSIGKENCKDNLSNLRQKLSLIVGRDVENLDINEILRASAETASENSVDGIFAPLFWIFVGTIFWEFNQSMPGPLAMAWIFKASSTIDSMIGYREGKLNFLGFSGAKLDDLMVWIPSRIVLISLPLCCKSKQTIFETIMDSWKDGLADSSPNSGISEAIFAYCAGVRMGGVNYYKGEKTIKPLIAKSYPDASVNSVKKILNLSFRLELVWITVFCLIIKFINL